MSNKPSRGIGPVPEGLGESLTDFLAQLRRQTLDVLAGRLSVGGTGGSGSGSGNTIIIGGGGTGGTDPEPDLTPPPTPTGVNVVAGIDFVGITTDSPTFTMGRGYLATFVYGKKYSGTGDLPTFSANSKQFEFIGEIGAFPTDPATQWHIWVKWKTRDGVLSLTPAGGTNGFQVTTGQDVALLLTALTGQIRRSELAESLGAPIDLIEAPATTPGSVAARIKVEADSRATLDGNVRALYTVRAEVSAGGRTVVGGFGLAGTASATQGPRIDFGVRADTFFVEAPSGGSNPTAKMTPFVIRTSATTENGVDIPAGVYMDAAYIVNLTASYAKIQSLVADQITAADIAVAKLTAGTLKVGSYIQSADYTSGANGNGYRISRDGVELPATSIRGQLVANQIKAWGLNILSADGTKTILNAGAALPIDNSVINPAAGWLNSNVKVGGRNLLIGASNGVGWSVGSYFGDTEFRVSGASVSEGPYIYSEFVTIPGNTQVTLTLESKQDGAVVGLPDIFLLPVNYATIGLSQVTYPASTDWLKSTIIFTTPSGWGSGAAVRLRIDRNATPDSVSRTYFARRIKLEYGNKDTDWTPPVEDVKAASDAAALAASNARIEADKANGLIDGISSDSLLSRSEKPELLRQWLIIEGEYTKIRDQAISMSINRDTFLTSVSNLVTFLNDLRRVGVGGVAGDWSNMDYDCPMDGPGLRAAFKTYTNARTDLLNAIAAKAATTADWAAGLSGRPTDAALLNSYLVPSINNARGSNLFTGSLTSPFGLDGGATISNPAYLDPYGTNNAVIVALPAANSYAYYRLTGLPTGFYTVKLKVNLTSSHSPVVSTTNGVTWATGQWVRASTPSLAAVWVQVVLRQYTDTGTLDIDFGTFLGFPAQATSPLPTGIAICDLDVQREGYSGDLEATKNQTDAEAAVVAQTKATAAYNAAMLVALKKAGDAISGNITIAQGGGVFTGLYNGDGTIDTNNGIYMSGLGLYGKKAGNVTFGISSATGDATFGGELQAVTGTFKTVACGTASNFTDGDGVWMDGPSKQFRVGNAAAYLRWSPTGGLEIKQDQIILSLTGGGNISHTTASTGTFTLGSRTANVVSGGTGPYDYAWAIINRDSDGGEIYTTGSINAQAFGVNSRLPTLGSSASAYARCVVTDASGRSASIQFSITSTNTS